MKLKVTLGIVRSLLIYFNPVLLRRNKRLYKGLLRPGDLVFDVGAHVGTRTRVMRSCGARVIAFEPQPAFARFLRYSLPKDVTLVEAALGSAERRAPMALSSRHPTVSSLRATLPEEAGNLPGFEHVRWDSNTEVRVTTLDSMIAQYGVPNYIKIDVEGYEAEVLSGLSQPIDLISLEYLPGLPDANRRAIRLLADQYDYEFNIVQGENPAFEWSDWQDAEGLLHWLDGLKPDAGSGDVYARFRPPAGR